MKINLINSEDIIRPYHDPLNPQMLTFDREQLMVFPNLQNAQKVNGRFLMSSDKT